MLIRANFAQQKLVIHLLGKSKIFYLARGRMLPEELEKLVVKHKAQGHLPFFVNCTTGTTVYGAFDPIHAIAGMLACADYLPSPIYHRLLQLRQIKLLQTKKMVNYKWKGRVSKY